LVVSKNGIYVTSNPEIQKLQTDLVALPPYITSTSSDSHYIKTVKYTLHVL